MRLTDRLFLRHLAKKHDIGYDLDEALRKADQLDDEEIRRLGAILAHLPTRTLRLCAEHPLLPDVIARFAEVSAMPDRQALAFLTLGVPIRGVVLPRLLREALEIVLYRKGRLLYVNGVPVRLKGLNYPQRLALREVDVPDV